MTIFHWGTLTTSLSVALLILGIVLNMRNKTGGVLLIAGGIGGAIVFPLIFFGAIATERVGRIEITELSVDTIVKTNYNIIIEYDEGENHLMYNQVKDFTKINDSTKFYVSRSYNLYDTELYQHSYYYYKNE